MSLSCANDPVTSIRKQNRNKRIHGLYPYYAVTALIKAKLITGASVATPPVV
jgi:hypothetical protein